MPFKILLILGMVLGLFVVADRLQERDLATAGVLVATPTPNGVAVESLDATPGLTPEPTPVGDDKNLEDGTIVASPQPEPEEEDLATVSDIEVTISNAAVRSDKVEVRAIVSDLVDGGVCTIEFIQDGQASILKSGGIQPVTSYSACEVLSADIAEFASPGEWWYTVSILANNTQYISNTQTITIAE